MIPVGLVSGPPGALAAVLAWIAAHWRLVLALALTGALWWQTERLEKAQADLIAREAQDRLGRAELRAHSAEAGQEALTGYVDRNASDAPVARSVAERVAALGVCPPAVVRSPGAAGAADAAGRRASDAEARAREAETRAGEQLELAQAAGADLEVCAVELNRLRSWQDWYNGLRSRHAKAR